MKLKPGIYGKTRRGDKVGPLKRDKWMAGTADEFSAPNTDTTWWADGMVDDQWNSHDDIVSEWED